MEFHKDISFLGWDTVRDRQLERLPLVKNGQTLQIFSEGLFY